MTCGIWRRQSDQALTGVAGKADGSTRQPIQRNPDGVDLRLALHGRRLTEVVGADAVQPPNHCSFFLHPRRLTQILHRDRLTQ
ncbi:hypothetical protein AHAS_Ahas08G0024900 [Arachis hypogaea]